MKIDDIPLPTFVLVKGTKEEINTNLNNQSIQNGTNHSFSMKRITNHKLPLGLLLKDSFSKSNEMNLPKKELFLPTTNDKIQLALTTFKPCERESVENLISKSYREINEFKKVKHDVKLTSKRKSKEKETGRESKRYRSDRSQERKRDYNTSRNKSKVVRDNDYSHRENSSRYVESRSKYRGYSRNRHHRSPSPRYLKRKSYHSSRCRRSRSRHRQRHSSHERHRSSERNGHNRNRIINNSSAHRIDSRQIVTTKRKRSISKKSSFASSTSRSSSSLSSDSSNVELPLHSPKSPDESIKRKMESNKESQLCSPVQKPTITSNVYLKQLKDTLDKINDAYKTVVAQIPDQKPCPDFELSAIPLPSSIIDEKVLKDAANGPNLPPMIDVIQTVTNGHKTRVVARIARSNSINADKLSCISDSSIASKVYRSPLHLFDVSSYSKESEHSDIKSRPVIPKITHTSIDYSAIEPAFFWHNSCDFFTSQIHCHCTMPNPDQWVEHGVRACGQGQTCVLRHLRIECNSQRCPTEALCNNCQFQRLSSCPAKNHNVELFFDIRHTSSWRLRTRTKVLRDTLLLEVAGKARMAVGQDSNKAESECAMMITRDIAVALRSDPHSMIYYIKKGRPDEANVRLEKWLVDGRIRVGVFAQGDLAPKTELVMHYRKDCLMESGEWLSLESEAGRSSALRSLVHNTVTVDWIESILDLLLTPLSPTSVLDLWRRMGGVPLLIASVGWYVSPDDRRESLVTKMVDLLARVPYDGSSLGMVLASPLDRLSAAVHALGPDHAHHEATIDRWRHSADPVAVQPSRGECKPVDSNLYILNCRLPTFWCSRECVCEAEGARVFFYHRVTRHVQWDMPVYPWETCEAGGGDDDVYDYNQASLCQVSHDEIAQMYLNLNRMYEIKQKRILFKENNPKPIKSLTDSQKKEVFRKKMMEFIVKLLKPYRDNGCQEGRITTDEDLRYLANKLSQTILAKELKILNNVAEFLEVTAVVENKTKAYVRTYLESRGSIYQRPSHQSDNVAKKVS